MNVARVRPAGDEAGAREAHERGVKVVLSDGHCRTAGLVVVAARTRVIRVPRHCDNRGNLIDRELLRMEALRSVAHGIGSVQRELVVTVVCERHGVGPHVPGLGPCAKLTGLPADLEQVGAEVRVQDLDRRVAVGVVHVVRVVHVERDAHFGGGSVDRELDSLLSGAASVIFYAHPRFSVLVVAVHFERDSDAGDEVLVCASDVYLRVGNVAVNVYGRVPESVSANTPRDVTQTRVPCARFEVCLHTVAVQAKTAASVSNRLGESNVHVVSGDGRVPVFRHETVRLGDERQVARLVGGHCGHESLEPVRNVNSGTFGGFHGVSRAVRGAERVDDLVYAGASFGDVCCDLHFSGDKEPVTGVRAADGLTGRIRGVSDREPRNDGGSTVDGDGCGAC